MSQMGYGIPTPDEEDPTAGGGGGGGAFPASIEVSNDVGSPLPIAGTVALDSPTLAALEQINVLIAAGQIVGLDSTTLTALENIVVSGTVALDGPTLAALENVNAVVSGEVALDAATLAALENITTTVSGSVSVSNFPAEYPLPAAQITTLTPQTNALTDAQLRNTPVPVGGVVALDAPTLAALEQITVAIQAGQIVGLDATSLAALESITVTATDLDFRNLELATDSVRQTQRAMSSYVAAQSAADGTVVAANVTAPTRVRILRLDGGSKPSNPADSFCTVTISLGANPIFVKEIQVGEPIGGQVCIEGAAGEDLTVAVSGTGVVQFNLRYETFQ